MKLIISEYAASRLDAIWDHYAAEASERVADRIVKELLADMAWLAEHPRGGQREPSLEHLGLGHRRLVSGHYKIIHRILADAVFVADVFDTRQDPERMVW